MKVAARAVLATKPLGFAWETSDPFLFCVYHRDLFPAAEGYDMKVPARMLRGRQIGNDFQARDGFRMYHGEEGVPGFPAHPHRGFETITIVTEGCVDHHDSLGAIGRYGGAGSDTQWVTTGAGLQHAEMFPLLQTDRPNHMELFQIWLNLPARTKFAKPHFTMLWGERNPVILGEDYSITVICDESGLLKQKTQPPPPESWASQAGSDVAIWLIELKPGARWTIPASTVNGSKRNIFFYQGTLVDVEGQTLKKNFGAELDSSLAVTVHNIGEETAKLMLLQGRPIGEPVVQRGPFVLNTQQELIKTFADYQRTQFGGWPHASSAPVHPREQKRFARYPDGRIEYPPDSAAASASDKGEL